MRLDLLQAELQSALINLEELKARNVALEARVRSLEAGDGREGGSAKGSGEARPRTRLLSAGSPE